MKKEESTGGFFAKKGGTYLYGESAGKSSKGAVGYRGVGILNKDGYF